MSLEEETQVAVVTGGATGIGRACAAELARSGLRVVILGRTEEKLLAAARELAAEGVTVDTAVADVTDRPALAAAFAALERVDVLVNSAGAMSQLAFDDISDGELRRLLDVNLIGVFAACQEAARRMTAGGRIVNIGSRAMLGGAGISHYAASKAAVAGLTRSLAIELLPRGITVNTVAPGFVDTPLSRGVLSAEQFAAFRAAQPLGRIVEPEDVAAAVAFLASPRARFITGQCLFVDAGKSLGAAP